MKDDEEFGAFLKSTLEDHRVEIPKDEIWSAIDRRRQGRTRSTVEPVRRGSWILRTAAILVLGIAIGRFFLPREPSPAVPGGTPALSVADAYLQETVGHFAQVELILSMFGEDRSNERSAETVAWARGLLADTQLLLDSPVSEEPGMRRLLEELELILAQIGSLGAEDVELERDLIQRSVDERDMLERLRTVANPGLAQGEI